MRTPRRAGAGLALAVGLLLAGCAGAADPPGEPEPDLAAEYRERSS